MRFRRLKCHREAESSEIPCKFAASREFFQNRDGFARDCLLQRRVTSEPIDPGMERWCSSTFPSQQASSRNCRPSRRRADLSVSVSRIGAVTHHSASGGVFTKRVSSRQPISVKHRFRCGGGSCVRRRRLDWQRRKRPLAGLGSAKLALKSTGMPFGRFPWCGLALLSTSLAVAPGALRRSAAGPPSNRRA
jgi:hypothetical protein